jgi:hypothetical protein
VAAVCLAHLPRDAALAAEVAGALHAAGLTTTRRSRRARVVVVVATPEALSSEPLTEQIVRAHQEGASFLPVLVGLTHADLVERQPEWRAAFGAATSVEGPPEALGTLLPRVVEGVQALLAAPGLPRRRTRPRATWLVAGGAVVLVAALGAWLLTRGGGSGTGKAGDRVIPRSTASFSPGPAADSATTPLRTVAGDLRVVRAVLTSQLCSTTFAEGCRTGTSGLLVVLTLSKWDDSDLVLTDDLARDVDRSYVTAGTVRAAFLVLAQEDQRSGTIRVAYDGLPASAANVEVRVAWPGSPTLRLHVES